MLRGGRNQRVKLEEQVVHGVQGVGELVGGSPVVYLALYPLVHSSWIWAVGPHPGLSN